jgi:hypothetical protein
MASVVPLNNITSFSSTCMLNLKVVASSLELLRPLRHLWLSAVVVRDIMPTTITIDTTQWLLIRPFPTIVISAFPILKDPMEHRV